MVQELVPRIFFVFSMRFCAEGSFCLVILDRVCALWLISSNVDCSELQAFEDSGRRLRAHQDSFCPILWCFHTIDQSSYLFSLGLEVGRRFSVAIVSFVDLGVYGTESIKTWLRVYITLFIVWRQQRRKIAFSGEQTIKCCISMDVSEEWRNVFAKVSIGR